MGTVYLAARADEQYQKRVALKIVRGHDSVEVLRHFRRERQILASLDHENIAKLLDGGTTDDGLPYFVMEYVDGQRIDAYCDSRSLSTAERLKLFRSVCTAVQHAHRNLVVHRDLKPGNILVTSDGVVKLLDFGIAKLLNPAILGDAPTATHLALTPEYASPEQARGEAITTATDVYSLGIVLYELLTGHRPYRVASRQPLDVLRAVVEEEPERPSTAVGRTDSTPAYPGLAPLTLTPESVSRPREGTPDRLRRRLKGDLDNIVLTALRKEPQQRYGSVEALAEDLRRHLEGLPVRARKATVGYRVGKFVRRHALGVTTAAALVVLIIGFGISMTAQSARVSRALEKAEKERAKSERVSAFLVDLFNVSDPSEARGSTVTAREVLDKGADRIATELKDQPEVRATLLDTIGKVYIRLGLYDKALPLLREALTIRRQVLGSRHPDLAETLTNLAVVLFRKGDYAASEALHREALAVRRAAFGDEHPLVAHSVSGLAIVVGRQGDHAGAAVLHREALALRRRLFGNEHSDVARGLQGLATVLTHLGDFAPAEAMAREGLALRRRLSGSDHPDVALFLHTLGNALYEQGDYAGAEAAFREGAALRRKLLGDDHPAVSRTVGNLAFVVNEKGDFTEAEALHRATLESRRKHLGEIHEDVAWGLTGLAKCLADQQRLAEAEPLYRDALRVWRKALPPGHPDPAYALVGLSRLVLAKGDARGAEPLLREALALRTNGLPANHPDIAEAATLLGACLTALGRYDEAEAALAQALRVLDARPGARSRHRPEAMQRRVELYAAWGRPVPARPETSLVQAGPTTAASSSNP
jgi:serine/threonine-protein kinase